MGERSIIEGSVVGRGATVGAGASLRGCYLLGDVTIEDGAQLQNCICCEGVVVGRNANVPPGCVLGRGVRVGAGVTLLPHMRFQTPESLELSKEQDDGFDDEEEEEDELAPGEGAARRAVSAATESAKAAEAAGGGLLGPDGVGILWKVVPTAASIGYERCARPAAVCGELSEEEDDEEMEPADVEADEAEAFAHEVGETVCSLPSELIKGSELINQVGETVRRAVESDHTVDNLALEVNSLKFAQNRTFSDCVRAIVHGGHS